MLGGLRELQFEQRGPELLHILEKVRVPACNMYIHVCIVHMHMHMHTLE